MDISLIPSQVEPAGLSADV
jgi:hypothetical protein